MLKGTGKPLLIIGGAVFELPEPAKGGRYEDQEDLTKTVTNPLGGLKRGKERFRFIAEYRLIKILSTLYNSIDRALTANGQRCILVPYSDNMMQKFHCLATIIQDNPKGYVSTKSVKLTFQGTKIANKRFNADDFIIGSTRLRGYV